MVGVTADAVEAALARASQPEADDADGWETTAAVLAFEVRRLRRASDVRVLADPVLVNGLRKLADDPDLLWEVARQAIEDDLIAWRDAGLSMPLRNNGFVAKNKDGTDSTIIRFGPEIGVRTALLALADHLEVDAPVVGGAGAEGGAIAAVFEPPPGDLREALERCLRLRNVDGTHKISAPMRNVIRLAVDAFSPASGPEVAEAEADT